ncbi:MAG TPA: type II secretion system protein [Humisphaera sp.]
MTSPTPADRRPRTAHAGGRTACGRGHRRAGVSLVQTVVVIAIGAVFAAIVLSAAARVRTYSRAAACTSNLRQIAAAFRAYAGENGGVLPNPAFSDVSWERTLYKYAGADGFACPGDEVLAPATGSSYDWRDTGLRDTTLAGEPLAAARPDAILAFDALPGWHGKKRMMNVVRADGSTAFVSSDEAVNDLRKASRRP